MGISIVITSGKGGVGKTTTTANISIALAKLGQKVCVVDLDIGLRNLDTVMNLSDRIIYDVVDVAHNRATVNQALVRDSRFEDNLYLLAASQSQDKDVLDSDNLIAIIDTLKEKFDFVIVDCPAGIEKGFKNAISVADGAIIVTNPEISAVSDADRTIGILEEYNMPIGPHLIINRIRKDMVQAGTAMKIEDIVNHLGLPLLGVIADENRVIEKSNQGESVVLDENSLAGQGYWNIAKRMLGEKIPLMNFDEIKEEKRGFFSRLFHKK